jgi:hypothetical protein
MGCYDANLARCGDLAVCDSGTMARKGEDNPTGEYMDMQLWLANSNVFGNRP